MRAYAGADLLAAARCAPSAASRPSGSRNRTEPARGLLGQGREVLGLAAEQRVPDRQREAVLEPDVGADGVERAG